VAQFAVGSNDGTNIQELRQASEFGSLQSEAPGAQRQDGFDFSDHEND